MFHISYSSLFVLISTLHQISFAPIGPSSSLLDARSAAVEFASKLYKQEKVPVFLYGEASPKKAYLKEIRKDLGYFLKVSHFMLSLCED